MPERIREEQRRALTAAALLPAAVNVLKAPIEAAGRLAWLCPLAALPVGLALCWAWKGQKGAFLEDLPRWLRWGLSALYLGWGVVLFWGSAGRFGDRLLRSVGTGGQRWAFLLGALALVLYLTRRQEVFARTGRIFFPAVAALLLGTLALTLPAVDWGGMLRGAREELLGAPLGGAWVLSLAGYVVYGAFLPVGGGEARGAGRWLGWTCAALSALLLAVVGVFGPALALRMDEPFLYLLSGVGVPGAFQRGEALLTALGALGDLTLLGLLAQGCGRLWGTFFSRGRWAPAVIGTALAILAPAEGAGLLTGSVGLAGNLALGAAVPLAVALGRKRRATFCGEKTEGEEDVGADGSGKKSFEKNEKKC